MIAWKLLVGVAWTVGIVFAISTVAAVGALIFGLAIFALLLVIAVNWLTKKKP